MRGRADEGPPYSASLDPVCSRPSMGLALLHLRVCAPSGCAFGPGLDVCSVTPRAAL